MTSRERFLAACACRPLERPPLWIMRQAGRYLPEYRALKAKHSFAEMVRTPELAVEVTLQPLRRFALDAAILFSDILVIPAALGQGYRFKEEGGIALDYRLESRAQLDRLATGPVRGELAYVAAALRLLRRELAGARAVLGFGGSPWTLACYMIEGGGSDDFTRARNLFRSDRPLFDALLERLTAALIDYFQMQIEAGADALQIFDTWGGLVAGPDYEPASLQWIRRILAALPAGFPVILYAQGAGAHLAAQAASGARILSVDSTVDLAAAHDALARDPALRTLGHPVALQGNLDPALLSATPEAVRAQAQRLLTSMRGRPGHIFNLGHGIRPDAKVACVAALADTVTGWKD
ncbi:MAG TPA: uroporphyrinogen decarboxylase [Opitutaceae bacterium]|nr:uroporphyrinogen decarboxylase [Opitutaceae bacterium]